MTWQRSVFAIIANCPLAGAFEVGPLAQESLRNITSDSGRSADWLTDGLCPAVLMSRSHFFSSPAFALHFETSNTDVFFFSHSLCSYIPHQRWAGCPILRSRSSSEFLKLSPSANIAKEVLNCRVQIQMINKKQVLHNRNAASLFY